MTITDLLGAWRERDSRYSMRRKNGVTFPLEPGEVESIKAFRFAETKDLPEDDQRLAQMALGRWSPPAVLR